MSFTQYLIERCGDEWQAYTRHEFVRQLAEGTLPKECFRHYLKQDYLFLKQYARALALAVYKSGSLAQMREIRESLDAIIGETQLHIAYCAEWGISEAELEREPESAAGVAYTRYVLDCGMRGTLADLFAALAPCPVGYADIGRHIVEHYPRVEGNPYQTWIDTYAAADFQTAAAAAARSLDAEAQGLSDSRRQELEAAFRTATRMEAAFWQMGLDCSL